MIDFELDFQYENEKVPALKCAKGRIEPGKCVVLCGGSGSGKSTLLKCMNRLIPQFYEGNLKGYCLLGGKDTDGMSVGEAGELVASVFQDPRSQFFTVNSSTEVAFALENHGISSKEMRRRVDEAFSLFNLEKLKDRNVYELSSGERQLVSILSAWTMDTDILVFDEPTANLDYTAIRQLRELLLQLKEQGKTMIFSEHRLYYLTGLADEYWLMSGGEIAGRYTAEEMLAFSQSELFNLSLRNTDLSNISLQKQANAEEAVTGEFAFGVSNLRFSYQKRTGTVLNGLTFSAKQGEVIGLIGRNGCGKTTLGKIMAGLLKPCSGEILYNGNSVNNIGLLKKSMFVLQEAEFQFFTNSVMNELKYGNKDGPEFIEEAERLLKKFDMWECRSRHPFSLSGGQMQKLALMIAYLSPKQIVILDEPTAGLDANSMLSCVELIGEMRKKKLVFIITHDIELIARICSRCVCVCDGKAEKDITMDDGSRLTELMSYMDKMQDTENNHAVLKPSRLHPATKLLFWLVTMIAVSTSNNALVFFSYLALILMVFADGWYAMAAIGGGIIAALIGLDYLFPNTAVSFALAFFPRVLAVGLSMCTLIGRNEASRTIASLRNFRVPEKLIMICSVVFRFFPTLSGDMILMRQSIRTRSAFVSFAEKIRAFPEYIEILTVPMALRVIRISETLSASAETRGIALKRRRHSYVSLKFSTWDLCFLVLLSAAVAAGIILYYL